MRQAATAPPKQHGVKTKKHLRSPKSNSKAAFSNKSVVGSTQHRDRIRGAAKRQNPKKSSEQSSSSKHRDSSSLFVFLRTCTGDTGTGIRFSSLLRVLVENRWDVRERIMEVPPLRGLLRPRTFRDICRRIDHEGRGSLSKYDFSAFLVEAKAWQMALPSEDVSRVREYARDWTQRAFVDSSSKALKSTFPCGAAEMQRACELIGLLGKSVDTLNGKLEDNSESLDVLDTECTELKVELEETATQSSQAADDFRREVIALRQRMRRRDLEQQNTIDTLEEQLRQTRAECAQVLQSVKGELIMMSGRASLDVGAYRKQESSGPFLQDARDRGRAEHGQDGMSDTSSAGRENRTVRLPPPGGLWAAREAVAGHSNADQVLANLSEEERLLSNSLNQLNSQLHGRSSASTVLNDETPGTSDSIMPYRSTTRKKRGERRDKSRGKMAHHGHSVVGRAASRKARWTSQ